VAPTRFVPESSRVFPFASRMPRNSSFGRCQQCVRNAPVCGAEATDSKATFFWASGVDP